MLRNTILYLFHNRYYFQLTNIKNILATIETNESNLKALIRLQLFPNKNLYPNKPITVHIAPLEIQLNS